MNKKGAKTYGRGDRMKIELEIEKAHIVCPNCYLWIEWEELEDADLVECPRCKTLMIRTGEYEWEQEDE